MQVVFEYGFSRKALVALVAGSGAIPLNMVLQMGEYLDAVDAGLYSENAGLYDKVLLRFETGAMASVKLHGAAAWNHLVHGSFALQEAWLRVLDADAFAIDQAHHAERAAG